MLETSTIDDLKPYLIMERIHPPLDYSYMVFNNELVEGPSVSEIGIYSVVLMDTT